MAVVSRSAEQRPDAKLRIRCPFLEVVSTDQVQKFPGGVTCERRRGRDRAPSRDEMTWLCANGHHLACPTFRRWRGA